MSNLELIKRNTGDISNLTDEVRELKEIVLESRGEINTLKQMYDIDEIKDMKEKMTTNNVLLSQYIEIQKNNVETEKNTKKDKIAIAAISVSGCIGVIGLVVGILGYLK